MLDLEALEERRANWLTTTLEESDTDINDLISEVKQYRAWHERLREVQLCGVCGRTCEIVHKTRSVELVEGRIARFHDAYEGDCWERLEAFVRQAPHA